MSVGVVGWEIGRFPNRSLANRLFPIETNTDTHAKHTLAETDPLQYFIHQHVLLLHGFLTREPCSEAILPLRGTDWV